MLKNISGLTIKFAENAYHFISAPNGTFAEIKEALALLTAHIVTAEAQAKAQADASALEASKVVVPEVSKE